MYKGERFNSISHLVGALVGLVGLVILVVLAVRDGDPWKIFSFSVYGSTLLFLYLASTLYHSLRGKAKLFFMVLDYHGIYLLIAGTYTPFTLVTLRGAWGWTIFAIVWTLAVIGIILDSIPRIRKGHRRLPLTIHLVMGWIILVALVPLLKLLTLPGFLLLLLGGLFYTFGVYFYIHDKRVPHYHGIWHLFVLAGSVLHYFTVLYYVL